MKKMAFLLISLSFSWAAYAGMAVASPDDEAAEHATLASSPSLEKFLQEEEWKKAEGAFAPKKGETKQFCYPTIRSYIDFENNFDTDLGDNAPKPVAPDAVTPQEETAEELLSNVPPVVEPQDDNEEVILDLGPDEEDDDLAYEFVPPEPEEEVVTITPSNAQTAVGATHLERFESKNGIKKGEDDTPPLVSEKD